MCYRVLRLLAIGLEVGLRPRASNHTDDGQISDPEWLSSRHAMEKGPSGSVLRVLHYPAISGDPDFDPEVDIRAGAHSDYGR